MTRRLNADLIALAQDIGPRNHLHPQGLSRAQAWITRRLAESGWPPVAESYLYRGMTVANLVAERRGTTQAEAILTIGAHYDTCDDTPGANDNATGIAALLTIAEALRDWKPRCTVRLVAFVNEEPPAFQSEDMGSLVHARAALKHGDRLVGMIALETMGCFSDKPGSQRFPVPALTRLYGDVGDFIAFVGDKRSAAWITQVVDTYRPQATVRGLAAALPAALPGIGWSDHWSFVQVGCPALMVTDTAPFRYVHYHQRTDTVDRIDLPRFTAVVRALIPTVRILGEKTYQPPTTAVATP